MTYPVHAMCRGTLKTGLSCPHYAVPGSDFCRVHGGTLTSLYTQNCRTQECDGAGDIRSGLCRLHHIVSIAQHMSDETERAELLAAVAEVPIFTDADRERSNRDSYLTRVRVDVATFLYSRDMAEQYGATAEQLRDITAPLTDRI